ncbi:adenosylcobinamide-GDP ribazoletransferase [Marinovum sp. 2_MG-2023]|uniref:adenosylcobinamide-GDP ribazoletransferase n=1 Tax=unclassified Marinovum TaxID=2647166 RepID=UPI0026E31899|nr:MULTISPECIES: adenosylcobinamide-GDP ribazoletransferase [unclassified Marinovum]MDO6732086.1 adenosylcobinamide-GDP ribazoletransferase [Marinovum sp. 2_MG-2023]MDO6781401.1 adenosylcobinamide-GDP ribazoletransferase [Marinovum sp. 1_MG-2023]
MIRREAHLALVLMTRLPLPRLAEPVPAIGRAAWAFALVGLVVGGLSAAVLVVLLGLGLPPSLAAGGALVAQVLLTGALHEDGLADMVDGVWGGQDRARRLEIMRDSRIGSYGTLALVLSIGLRWQALAVLAANPAFASPAFTCGAILAVAMSSRSCVTLALALLPAARADGLGQSATGVGRSAVFLALILGLVPVLALAFFGGSPAPLFILPVQALALFIIARLALTRLGGQTGDVLGATQQVTEIAGLLALAAR